MASTFYEDQTFEQTVYTGTIAAKGEFVHCNFNNCDFTSFDLGKWELEDCVFTQCNFTMAQVRKTKMRDVRFKNCKLMGLDFSGCDEFLFSVSFENCQLDYASFFGRKMKKTKFISCSMRETNLEEADFSQAIFDHCDLLAASFVQTNLEQADLRTALNYGIDPEQNKIKKAKFSVQGLPGLLTKYDIEIED